MKKLLVLLALFSSVVKAENITVVNPSNKSSPASVFAMAYYQALGSDTKFYQSQTCEDAQKTFETTKDSVMIFTSSVAFGAKDKNLNCHMKAATVENTVYIGKHYMSLCTLKDSGKTLYDSKVTLGMPSLYSTKPHEDEFREAGINATLVPYGGSKDIITALLNNDISAGYISSAMAERHKDLVCHYQTNPELPNYIGNKFKMRVPDFTVNMIVYTNSNDPVILNRLKNIKNNQEFGQFLINSGDKYDWNVSQKDIDDANSYIIKLFKNWSSNSSKLNYYK